MKHQERSHKTKSPQSRIPSVRLKSRILTENEGEIIEENDIKAGNQTVDYISQCQYILDNALTPYALMLASSSLLKQVTEHSLSLQLRLDIRNYLVSYLANRGPKLQPFVIASLIQLLCRVTKFGWFDDDRFREVVKESTNFLSQVSFCHEYVLHDSLLLSLLVFFIDNVFTSRLATDSIVSNFILQFLLYALSLVTICFSINL